MRSKQPKTSVPLWPLFLVTGIGSSLWLAWQVGASWNGAARPAATSIVAPTTAMPVSDLAIDPGASGVDHSIVAAASTVGTAESFTGGDPRGELAQTVRKRLNETLATIRSLDLGVAATLCSVQRCTVTSDPVLCERLQSLSDAQRDFCGKFLRERAPELVALNDDSVTPIRLSAVPLTVAGPTGAPRPVTAITRSGRGEPIIFHEGTLKALSPELRLALLVHELGHKIVLAGVPIPDDKPVGPFPEGQKFLDTVGAAVALFASGVAPASVTTAELKATDTSIACGLAEDPLSQSLAGMILDLAGELPQPEELKLRRRELAEELKRGSLDNAWGTMASRVVESRPARERLVQALFERFLRRVPTRAELDSFIERRDAGEAWDVLAASLMGDAEYARNRQATDDAQFVRLAYLDLTAQKLDALTLESHRLRVARMGRSAWVLGLLRKDETAKRSLVTSWFRAYLNRGPSAEEAQRLAAAMMESGDWTRIQAAILSSPEYRAVQTARWASCNGASTERKPASDSVVEPASPVTQPSR